MKKAKEKSFSIYLIIVSSAVDAVGVNVPNLVLTTDAVGKLPVTSDIQNR